MPTPAMPDIPLLPAVIQASLDALPDAIFMKDLHHRWIACNQAFCDVMGRQLSEVLGHRDDEYFPPHEVEVFWRSDDDVIEADTAHEEQVSITYADGKVHTIWVRKIPVHDQGKVVGLSGIMSDITELQRRREEIEQLEKAISEKMAIIEAQTSLLDELSVPVVQVWDKILLLPLVGFIDTRRATHIIENLLHSISGSRARTVIIDITGVQVVDTSTASNLVRAMQAAQLLGCASILVGISPPIAQTLVSLGVDFSNITTLGTLQDGLKHALQHADRSEAEPVIR
jgi:rsbT co-antagonist protein RsbR